LEIRDDAKVLTVQGIEHLHFVVAAEPFDARLVVTNDRPTMEDLDRYAHSLVSEPNMVVVVVDPLHHRVQVHFGIASHVPREAWESIERSGNPAFRRGDFEGGAADIFQAAARAVELANDGAKGPR
jgi:hypothetical protein